MTPKALSSLLKILATERRVQILKILLESPTPIAVSNLSALMGIPEDGPVSWNLARMHEVGLVLKHNSGRWVLYSANRVVLRELVRFWRTKPRGDEE